MMMMIRAAIPLIHICIQTISVNGHYLFMKPCNTIMLNYNHIQSLPGARLKILTENHLSFEDFRRSQILVRNLCVIYMLFEEPARN